MSERFYGRGWTVRFSSGAVEELYRAWIALGERLPQTEESARVLDWLRDRLDHGIPSGRAFSLDKLPHALETPQSLAFLARIVEAFARELATMSPSPDLADVIWDRTRCLSWLARMLDLYEMIRGTAPPGLIPAPTPMEMSEADCIEVEKIRIEGRRD